MLDIIRSRSLNENAGALLQFFQTGSLFTLGIITFATMFAANRASLAVFRPHVRCTGPAVFLACFLYLYLAFPVSQPMFLFSHFIRAGLVALFCDAVVLFLASICEHLQRPYIPFAGPTRRCLREWKKARVERRQQRDHDKYLASLPPVPPPISPEQRRQELQRRARERYEEVLKYARALDDPQAREAAENKAKQQLIRHLNTLVEEI